MDDLLKTRASVLTGWETGKEVTKLEEGLAYQQAIPDAKRFDSVLFRAHQAGKTLTQPRAGVCLVHEHIKLLKTLETEGQADLLPTTIDSYTRQNRYKEAATGIEESVRNGRSLLNGFPAVNHGVGACRRVTEAMTRPVQVRHGTPDARLLCEITLAGGFTAFEGGGISYNIPYAKNVPLEKSLLDWQYVDRLIGHYAENGVLINREPFGPLTGTMVPPSLSNTIAILEALLAAEQGVKSICVGYGQCGNLYQDVAAIRSLRSLCKKYLDHYNFGDTRLTTVFHQWMGGFPPEEPMAFSVISWGATAAAFARVTKVITKSPHEAMGIPTAEANVAGLKTSQQILRMLDHQQELVSSQVDWEQAQIEKETTVLLEATIKLGEGDLAQGAVRAFKAGILDVPFAPSRAARVAVVPVRDQHGAVRFFEFGSLPFDEEIKAVHRNAIAERAKAERRAVSFQMVTDDIYAISKGQLVGTPR